MITRDNYEEFFLLYIDNELSVSDREAVERFVAHHPDLRQEWKSLLHCRLLPEEQLVFPDKEALYREATPEEEDSNFPRFSPDLSIVFPYKAGLYKQEKDERIIGLPWWRIGVAAAAAGIVALLVLATAKNNKNISPVTPAAAATLYSSGKRDTVDARNAVGTPGMVGTRDVVGTRDAVGTKPGIRPKTDSQVIRPVQLPVTGVAVGNPGRKEKKAALLTRQDVQEETLPNNKDLVQQSEPHDPAPVKTADISATRVAITTSNVRNGDAVAALQSGIPREESSFATQALQQENENHDQDNNILVPAQSSTPGKGKLRGLFRKVTRTFGKTADRDSDGQREVLIGAFQFALK